MGWDERQALMLAEMGIRLWPAPHSAARSAAVPAELEHRPFPPAERGGGETGALQEGAVDAAAGVAAMDWRALRAAVAACTACALCESRRNTVFGVGHQQAHWMIVGEAPGEQEDDRGEPFVGKAGQLLDNMLAALGLSRAAEGEPAERVFIANVLKCRPPGNRNPMPDEVARCAPFLERQVALLRPRLILALGRFAVNALLASDEPIGRLRGRVHRYRGVPVVVSYHPAYLLRNPADKARAWDDLCLARETMLAAAG